MVSMGRMLGFYVGLQDRVSPRHGNPPATRAGSGASSLVPIRVVRECTPAYKHPGRVWPDSAAAGLGAWSHCVALRCWSQSCIAGAMGSGLHE